jgi:catechol 2,3-dioxygenase-like lactoylglutathione lyase family enzyme
MPVTQIQVVSIPVSDQNRAKSFYLDTLGFRLLADEPMGPDQRWVQLAPPDGGAGITLVTWFEAMSPGSVKGLVLGCTDIQATYDELSSRGVRFSGAIERQEWGTFATFEDPDGNGWVLSEISSQEG